MIEWLHPFTHYLNLHPWVAIAFAGFVAFLESLAIIGAIIPGSVTLTAIGVMMGSGIIPIYPTVTAAILGAILGDAVSYFLGRYYHENIRQIWPFSSYPNLLTQGEVFFRQHGGKSIFLGRFVGPLRAILPLVAGMLDMPMGYFILSDIFSAFLWAPAYLLPGMLVGAATLELPPEAATYILVYLALGLLLASMAVWLLNRIIGMILFKADRLLAGFWIFLRRHQTLKSIPRWLHHDVARGHRQFAFIIAIVISLLLFLCILSQAAWLGDHNKYNRAAFALMQSLRTGMLDNVVLAITYFGEKNVVYFASLLVIAFLMWQRNIRPAIFIGLNITLCSVIIGICKILVVSPRPANFVSVQESYSFPSGHAGLFTASVIFITWLLARNASRPVQKSLSFMVVASALLIGATRLYLGDHWLIDVIGGIAIGVFSASLSALVFSFRPSAPIPIRKTALVIILAFIIGALGHASLNWHADKIGRTYRFADVHLSRTDWWSQTTPILDRYRENRLGMPTDFLNVQWLGSKDQIEQALLQKGWKHTEPTSGLELIKRLFAKDPTQVLPVLDNLLYHRVPDLLLVKSMPHKPLVILRLWKMHSPLSDSTQPLWIGTIEYHLIWKHHWLSEHKELLADLPDPVTVLLDERLSTQYKLLHYPKDKTVLHTLNPNAPQAILLLQS